MLRPAPRRASSGLVRVANQAGAVPKMMPVTSATAKANPRTMGDGSVLMGMKCEPRKASASSSRPATIATPSPAMPPADRQQDGLNQRLPDDLPPVGPQRQAQGGLSAAGHRPGQQQVRDIGAGDQQHHAADREQNLQTAAVLFFHFRHARARRNHVDHLSGKHANDVRHPVGGIAGFVLHPLPQDSGRAAAPCRRWTLRDAGGR